MWALGVVGGRFHSYHTVDILVTDSVADENRCLGYGEHGIRDAHEDSDSPWAARCPRPALATRLASHAQDLPRTSPSVPAVDRTRSGAFFRSAEADEQSGLVGQDAIDASGDPEAALDASAPRPATTTYQPTGGREPERKSDQHFGPDLMSPTLEPTLQACFPEIRTLLRVLLHRYGNPRHGVANWTHVRPPVPTLRSNPQATGTAARNRPGRLGFLLLWEPGPRRGRKTIVANVAPNTVARWMTSHYATSVSNNARELALPLSPPLLARMSLPFAASPR
ncbi:hypothetical protein BP5796_02667 [Coleophoma crateriformis]|uniref:Uncharacterized protein n=1 Tax=Coleophoma crateriformis TaxID=565419 RepID=A0A3D8SYW7_9HELO|nr:hypothetical protein BP5796_02667 [Coleophoma crateriformis]